MARPPSTNPKTPQIGIAVPHDVLIQLRALAIRERCSLRCLVLKALPSIGIHVEPADIVGDRRQQRPKGTRKNYTAKPKVDRDA